MAIKKLVLLLNHFQKYTKIEYSGVSECEDKHSKMSTFQTCKQI